MNSFRAPQRQVFPLGEEAQERPSQHAKEPPQAWPEPEHGGVQVQLFPWQSPPVASSRQRRPSQQGAAVLHFWNAAAH